MYTLKGPFSDDVISHLAKEIKEHGITVIFYRNPQEIVDHIRSRTDLKDELVFEPYGIENPETGELKRTDDEYCIYIKGRKPETGIVDWENGSWVSKYNFEVN